MNKGLLSENTEDHSRLKKIIDLYDNAPCGTLTFQKDGLIIEANSTFVNWLGYSKEEVVNKRTLSSFLKIGGQIYFETHFYPLINLQGHIKEVYFDFIKKDASEFRGLINVRKIPSTKEKESLFQAIILDVSERWHYESELRKAKKKAEKDSKAKADLLATISHEIRTPLNSIVGIGNLLGQTPLNDNQREYAKLLLHSSEHLLSLVNNLLDMSKIEANKYALEKKPFSLPELLIIIEEIFSVKASKKNISFDINLDKNVPEYVLGDSMKLKQILINLIGNATKFTKKGGVSVNISAVEKEKTKCLIRFEVEDTGIGIPKEKLNAIFDEFSQASSDVHVEFGGTGLGLTISKKLLELHNTDLEVSSTLNEGSCFSFDILYDLYKNKPNLQKNKLKTKTAKNLKYLSVLLVDDNPANLFVASQYLEQWDVSYQTAESGTEAIEIIKEEAIDIILLDLQMPKKNGYETAKEIRQLALKKQPIIIAFSASSLGNIKKKLDDAGFNSFLPKPFQPEQFYNILSEEYDSNILPSTEVDGPEIAKTNTTNAPLEDELASFNLDRYRKMSKNNPIYLKKFVISTLDGLITYQSEFESAMAQKSKEAISSLIHKSTMSLYYINAEKLTKLLNECRDLLDHTHPERFDEAHQQCDLEFKSIIAELKKIAASLST